MKQLSMILTALLIVITDPYKDIKYDEANFYNYENSCNNNCIGYTESEGWNESEDVYMLSEEEELYAKQVIEVAKQIMTLTSPVMQ